MTSTLAAGLQEPQPIEQPVARRSLRWVGWVVIAVVALLAGSFATWRAVTVSALDGVTIEYDSRPVECSGTEVGDTDAAQLSYFAPVVVLDEGMECVLRFHVANDGWATVQVDSVTLAMLGSDNVLGLEAHFVNPNGPDGVDVEGGRTFALDFSPVQVLSGESTTFEAWFGYGGGAVLAECASQGTNIPRVTVSVPGASAEVASSERQLIWFQEGSLEECAQE